MIDSFGRTITYLRLSLTDRCDMRCIYCLGMDPEYLPKAETLSIEEQERLCETFIGLGIRKIRLTGGEPLLRKGAMGLIERLGQYVAAGQLDELTLTTNGTRLVQHAAGLYASHIRRVNVSLDSLDPTVFRTITQGADIDDVLKGLDAAKAAGLAIKINTVILSGVNDDGIDRMIAWCGEQGFDLTLIEVMPLGAVAKAPATSLHLPLETLRDRVTQHWTLVPSDYQTAGPARYVTVAQTGRRLGFIAPLSARFCDGCNRIRVTCSGRLYTCLGHENGLDLRPAIRGQESAVELQNAILQAIATKPVGHDFTAAGRPASPRLVRRMNVTGG